MSFEDLSIDVLREIDSYLEMSDLKHVAYINRKVNRMCKNNAIWENKTLAKFSPLEKIKDYSWFNQYRISMKSKVKKNVYAVIVSDKFFDETLAIFNVHSEKEVKEILVNIINQGIQDNWPLYCRLSSMYNCHYRTKIEKPLSLYDLDTILNYSTETLKIKQLPLY